MEETKKPAWQSKTIIINALGLIVQGAALLFPQANVVTQFINNHPTELLVGWNVLSIVLRFVTKGSVVLTD